MIYFQTMVYPGDRAPVLQMMRALYDEDPAAQPVGNLHFLRTIESLGANPALGRIVVFREDGAARGYALLIPHWSNEYGGIVLCIDELFVTPEYRSRGIGRSFFEFLDKQRPFDAIALNLEVSPGNTRARRLYESLGLRQRHNLMLARSL